MADKVRDLRSALERLKTMEGQYIETDVEVDPMAELARSLPLCRCRWNSQTSDKRRTSNGI